MADSVTINLARRKSLSEWDLRTLGELCEKPQYGFTTKAATQGRLKLLRTTDITQGPINWDSVPYCSQEPDDDHKYLLQDGDIVISRSGSVGASALITNPPCGVFASYLIRFRARRNLVLPSYLAWYLRSPSYWAEVRKRASGIGMNNINAKKLAAIPVPIPSLEGQREIVRQLEDSSSLLNIGNEYVATSKERVMLLKRSVLAAEFSKKWPMVTLDEVLLSLRNGLFVSRPARNPPGIPILRISAVRPMEFDASDHRYAPSDLDPDERYFLQNNDLLFTRYSGNPNYVGACALVEGLTQPVLHPDKLMRAVVDRSRAEPAFLALACSTGSTLEEIVERRKTTAGQVGIAGGQLKSVLVPLPPPEVQREIVERVDLWRKSLSAVEGQIGGIKRRAAVLRDAVLTRAFSGERMSR